MLEYVLIGGGFAFAAAAQPGPLQAFQNRARYHNLTMLLEFAALTLASVEPNLHDTGHLFER